MSPLLQFVAAAVGLRAVRRNRRSLARLSGKRVLITGGSRGLGLAMAREFARAGCRIAICARDEAELDEAWRDLHARGTEIVALRADISRREDVVRMMAEAHALMGGVDILINNAAIIQVGPVETMTADDFERVMAVNFHGLVHCSLAVSGAMRARGEGQIVNITSIGAKIAVPHMLPYDCAKFAALGFSEGLHAELARHGIAVTTIVPGLMRTGGAAHAEFKGDSAKEFRWFAAGGATPLTAMSAVRAARRIVLATARREREVTLGWQAKLFRFVHAVAPGATQGILAAVNRALPTGDSRRTPEGRQLSAPAGVRRLLARQSRKYHQQLPAR